MKYILVLFLLFVLSPANGQKNKKELPTPRQVKATLIEAENTFKPYRGWNLTFVTNVGDTVNQFSRKWFKKGECYLITVFEN
jgi:hypothetical protein